MNAKLPNRVVRDVVDALSEIEDAQTAPEAMD